MKNLAVLLSWFPLFILPAQGRSTVGSLSNRSSFRKQSREQQSVLGVIDPAAKASNLQLHISTPPANPGKCQDVTGCLYGCWCDVGLCYGGTADERCATKENGYNLGDGGYCWDGRRDHNCLARDPQNSEEDDGAMDEAEKQTAQTMAKAKEMDPYQMVLRDCKLILGFLMPGKRPNIRKKIPELLLVFATVIWFAIYKLYLYEDDRCEKTDRWANVAIEPRHEDPRIKLMSPDIVLVFHKPDFAYPDKDNEVAWSTLEKALTSRSGHMPRSEELLQALKAGPKNTIGEKIKNTIGKVKDKVKDVKEKVTDKVKGETKHEDKIPEEEGNADTQPVEPTTTLSQARTALLQDLCEHLPHKGYEVSCFSSVDNDEVFVCIGLRNETTIMQHLQRYGMKLQLKQEVISRLGIDQPSNEVESSPPYIRYDRRLASNVFGAGTSDLDIFRNFGAHSGKPVVISGIDRIRIIHEHLNHQLDLDKCVSSKLLVQWFPAHAEARIVQLQKSWARWGLISDLTIRQPLSLLNEYFGSRVAFIWAWIGLYAKMLLCLLPAAVLWEVLNFIAFFVGKTEVWHRGSVMGFGLAIVIWGRFASNLWRQEEMYLKSLWDLNHVGKDRSERPDFHGKLEPDVADLKMLTVQYPEWKYTCRKAISWVITLLFCTFVFLCVVTWLNLFNGRMTIGASIFQAIMVQIFTLIYNWMAEALTLAENHKFQEDFYSSYLKKMFIFQLVNQYSAFFYMAIKQQFTSEGCPDGDCMGLIRGALPLTLAVLALLQIVQVFIGTFLVKLNFMFERWQMEKDGLEPPVYGFVEEQAKFGRFRVREQIEVMTQLSLTLGYVLIFGCIAPRIVPLCFVVFAVQLRAGGVLMTTAVNRTVPRISVGIGAWSEVFSFQLVLGVLFSAYLLVQFGPLFRDTMVITKLTAMFFYMFFTGLICVGVDILCPPIAAKAELLEERRNRVEHKVNLCHEDKNFLNSGPAGMATPPGENLISLGEHSFTDEVVSGKWESVPKLIPDAEASDKVDA